MSFRYKIFYKKDAEVFDWLKVFRPLDYIVWIALLVWIFLGGLATFFLTKVEKNIQNQGKNYSLITCIYFVLRALCCQGKNNLQKIQKKIFLFSRLRTNSKTMGAQTFFPYCLPHGWNNSTLVLSIADFSPDNKNQRRAFQKSLGNTFDRFQINSRVGFNRL